FAQRLRAWKRAAPAAEHSHSHDGHTHTHDGHTHDHDHHLEHSHDTADAHHHDQDHDHDHIHDHDHAVQQSKIGVPSGPPKSKIENAPSVPHTHGPFSRPHTHVPADGQNVSLRSLLALGITGGIIPCPSALVVLLVAVYFGKVALGLSLMLAFRLGLASVLTGIGILMV